MEFKETKELFSRECEYDSKHINNTCSKRVSEGLLSKIEQGITLEDLDKVTEQYDVFRYRTQITIHGEFPEMSARVRVGGYRNVFQNKNKSVGIRWNAIDTGKRLELFNTIGIVTGLHTVHNSTDLFGRRVLDYTEVNMSYLKDIAERVDTSLFYGRVSCYSAVTEYGRRLAVLDILINAFYAENKVRILENITGRSIEEIERIVSDKKERDRIRYEELMREYDELRRKQLAESKKRYERNLKYEEELVAQGWEYRKPIAGDTFASCAESFESPYMLFYKARKYGDGIIAKPCKATRNEDGTFTVTEREQASGRVYKVRSKVRYLCAPRAAETKSATERRQSAAEIKPNADVRIIDYSERAIAVVGDTRAIKDKLKSLGGRFNPRLTCGAGWIFPKTKLESLRYAL